MSEKPQDLKPRTKACALRVIRMCSELPKKSKTPPPMNQNEPGYRLTPFSFLRRKLPGECWLGVLLVFSPFVSLAFSADSQVGNVGEEQVDFRSFLTSPQSVLTAELEIRNANPPDVREAMERFAKDVHNSAAAAFVKTNFAGTDRSVTCTIKYDGSNFILNRSTDGYTGRFDDIEWKIQGNSLILVERKINRIDGPWLSELSIAAMPIKRLLNLGIENMTIGSAKWLPGLSRFTALSEPYVRDTETPAEPGHLSVQLLYSNDVPIEATSREDSMQENLLIRYEYDKNFYEGKLPVAFTATDLSRPNQQPIFSLRIKKLELSKEKLNLSEFDPRLVLKGEFKSIIVRSNNIDYIQNKRGFLRALMYSEKAQQRTAEIMAQNRTLPAYSVKTLLIIAIFVSPICFLIYQIKHRHR